MNAVRLIVAQVNSGNMSYDEGKEKCKPYLEVVNKRGREIAKKYGKRFAPITFAGVRR